MAEDTLTLKEDDGTTAHTFTKRKVDATGATLWDSPAADGSLAGLKTLVRKSNKTRAAIVTRTSLLTLPVTNPVTGKEGSIQRRETLNAPDWVTQEQLEDAHAMGRSSSDPALNADFVVNFVRGY